jgi:hypothetical protein
MAGDRIVKDLEWEHLGGDFYRAPAPLFGSIRVEKYSDTFFVNWSVPGFCGALVKGEFPSAEEAKAAAQDHVEMGIQLFLAADLPATHRS